MGWSQEEAAQRLGYRALSTVSKIENGTQGVKLQSLAHFFEVLQIHDPAPSTPKASSGSTSPSE
ncbi:multiprotein-bridging factor 1 family protein [Streptomyces sp. NPDC096205]|uniref:helix-turn-helix domain-containing protein n=1 Tax=Streptomyces sp. NPDC096205 TaxID=3366081 RepID=UPI00382FDF12